MLALALLAPAARATVTPIASGALDWGVKQSFRSYVTGPIARGAISVGGGASVNSDGTFHFPLSGGSFDDDTGATIVAFGGSVRFTGHDGQLDMTISDVRVELAPDGARLLADIASLPFPAGGSATTYPDVELLRLDLTGIDPAIAGGETSWAAIPAVLSPAGAPAFAGFYGSGTAFDAISFAYAGPGGAPLAEGWSDPGAPFFDDAAEVTGVGGYNRVFADPAHDALHVVSDEGVRAYDLETLAPLASADDAGLDDFAIAFDPETATVFAGDADGRLRSFAYDAADGAYDEDEVPMAPARTLDYDPATGKLWAIGTPAPSPMFAGNPTVQVATRDGAGWDVATYPDLDTSGRNVRSVARSSGGDLVVTFAPFLASVSPLTFTVFGSAALTDTGSALVATDVPGTVADAPAAGTTQGYLNAAAAPSGGRVLLSEQGLGLARPRLLTLAPSAANASGYAVEGTPLATGAGLGNVVFDRDDGSLYALLSDTIAVYRDGAAVAAIPAVGIVAAAGGEGALYAASNTTGELTRWSQAGTAPVVVEQPEDALVTLPAADASAAVTFSAAAGGTPAPSVRWQQRAPGATAWTDVPGATASTLQVTATAALAGTRYRAVFESAAGRLASAAATLAVTVRPPVVQPPVVDPPVVDPPVTRRPAPSAPVKPPLLDASRRRAAVGDGGRATLATLRCRAGGSGCRVQAPRRVRVRIDGRRWWVQVLAPATLRAGQRGTVRVLLPRAARSALAGHRATVAFDIAISAGRQRTQRRVRVTLVRR